MLTKEMTIKILKTYGRYGDITIKCDMEEIIKFINYQNEEIEKLNNIINELEKWAKEELEQPNWASCGARCMLDKLQELKGDDKEC